MLSQDKSRYEGYRFLWQKIKPQVMEQAQDRMDRAVPPERSLPSGVMPDVMRRVNAAKHRREH